MIYTPLDSQAGLWRNAASIAAGAGRYAPSTAAGSVLTVWGRALRVRTAIGTMRRISLVCRSVFAPERTANCQTTHRDEFSRRPGCAIKRTSF
jgi:hypothetical protein